MLSFLALLDIISKFCTIFISPIFELNPPPSPLFVLAPPGGEFIAPPAAATAYYPKNGEPILTISMLRLAMELFYWAALLPPPLPLSIEVTFCWAAAACMLLRAAK